MCLYVCANFRFHYIMQVRAATATYILWLLRKTYVHMDANIMFFVPAGCSFGRFPFTPDELGKIVFF